MFKFHPLAELELDDAVSTYGLIDDDLAYDLQVIVEDAVAKIVADPERWRVRRGGYRRVNLDRFPYYLPYVIHNGIVWILAVAHERRKPHYWSDRKPGEGA